MKQRSPLVVVILSLVTFGIYMLVWMVKTKNEMNETYNAGIPTAWLCWVPVWWAWKYSGGVERATRGKVSQVVSLLLLLLLPIVGQWVIQAKFNETVQEGAPALKMAA